MHKYTGIKSHLSGIGRLAGILGRFGYPKRSQTHTLIPSAKEGFEWKPGIQTWDRGWVWGLGFCPCTGGWKRDSLGPMEQGWPVGTPRKR